jgi:hypothetical protein
MSLMALIPSMLASNSSDCIMHASVLLSLLLLLLIAACYYCFLLLLLLTLLSTMWHAACAAGYFANKGKCTACPVGKISPAPILISKAPKCKSCPAGRTTAAAGSATCRSK